MDYIIEKFKAGYYDDCGDYRAFHPEKINGLWTWSDSRLNLLLAEANKELGGLNTYSELVKDIDLYIIMHLQVEANKSNRIEGTKTSVEDDLMDIEDVLPEKRDDVREIQNYIKAMNYGVDRIVNDDFPFTTRLIRELHGVLLQGVRGEYKTPGEFRRTQNFIGGTRPSNAAYVPPAVNVLPEILSDFDNFMNLHDDIPTLIKAAIIHYQFETIHPFLDGNGRIGRLIIPLYLLSQKELSKPCFYISDYFEKSRSEYYERLQAVRKENDMLGWICFFLKATSETARTAKIKFQAAVAQKEKYQMYLINKKSGSSASLQKIIEALYKKPVANAVALEKMTGLSIPTINKCTDILVKDNVLTELTGNRRNRVYALMDYINVFN